MSTLHTLHDAFAELERRADNLSTAPESLASAAPRPTHLHRTRRTLAPLAAAAAVAALVAGVTAAVTFLPTPTEQPAAPASPGVITLWQAKTAPCPPQPAQHAAAGAVLRYLDGCVKLDNLAATLTSPVQARVTGSNGRWAVDVTLNKQQTSTLARVTTDAIGRQVAVVGDGQVLLAPIVRAPIVDGSLRVSGLSADEANNMKHLLGNR